MIIDFQHCLSLNKQVKTVRIYELLSINTTLTRRMIILHNFYYNWINHLLIFTLFFFFNQ